MKSRWITGVLVCLAGVASLASAQDGLERSVLEGEIEKAGSAKASNTVESLPPPKLVEDTGAKPIVSEADTLAATMLESSNRFRVGAGLSPQRLSTDLTTIAQQRADSLARTGWISGESTQKSGRKENIAIGHKDMQSVFEAWKKSTVHRANMSTSANVAGFGYARNSSGVTYWVAVYGPSASSVVQSNFTEPSPRTTSRSTAPSTTTQVRRPPATSTPPRQPTPEPPGRVTRREERRESRREDGFLPRFRSRRD